MNEIKILLVEDEEKLARFVELELNHEGYSVTKAFTGRDGYELHLRAILTWCYLILCYLS